MKSRKQAALLSLAVALISFCVFMFWPGSFEKMFLGKVDDPYTFRVSAVICSVPDGNLHMDHYEAEFAGGTEGHAEIVRILDSTKYIRDIRNLFPSTLEGYGTQGGDMITLDMLPEAPYYLPCQMIFMNETTLAFPLSEGGFHLYHLTDRTVMDQLKNLVRQYGTKQ